MQSTQSDSDNIKTPFKDSSTASPISDLPRPNNAKLVKRIELKPTEQKRIPLRSYTDNAPPRGFSIEITPDPDPANSVSTKVISLGTTKDYRLVLHIANYGTRDISAEIWQL